MYLSAAVIFLFAVPFVLTNVDTDQSQPTGLPNPPKQPPPLPPKLPPGPKGPQKPPPPPPPPPHQHPDPAKKSPPKLSEDEKRGEKLSHRFEFDFMDLKINQDAPELPSAIQNLEMLVNISFDLSSDIVLSGKSDDDLAVSDIPPDTKGFVQLFNGPYDAKDNLIKLAKKVETDMCGQTYKKGYLQVWIRAGRSSTKTEKFLEQIFVCTFNPDVADNVIHKPDARWSDKLQCNSKKVDVDTSSYRLSYKLRTFNILQKDCQMGLYKTKPGPPPPEPGLSPPRPVPGMPRPPGSPKPPGPHPPPPPPPGSPKESPPAPPGSSKEGPPKPPGPGKKLSEEEKRGERQSHRFEFEFKDFQMNYNSQPMIKVVRNLEILVNISFVSLANTARSDDSVVASFFPTDTNDFISLFTGSYDLQKSSVINLAKIIKTNMCDKIYDKGYFQFWIRSNSTNPKEKFPSQMFTCDFSPSVVDRVVHKPDAKWSDILQCNSGDLNSYSYRLSYKFRNFNILQKDCQVGTYKVHPN